MSVTCWPWCSSIQTWSISRIIRTFKPLQTVIVSFQYVSGGVDLGSSNAVIWYRPLVDNPSIKGLGATFNWYGSGAPASQTFAFFDANSYEYTYDLYQDTGACSRAIRHVASRKRIRWDDAGAQAVQSVESLRKMTCQSPLADEAGGLFFKPRLWLIWPPGRTRWFSSSQAWLSW